MAKQLEITAEIEARIKASAGDDQLDVASFAVFETVLADSRPLNKRGSLFDKARISRSTLAEMAEYLDAGNSIPLHTLHLQGHELPVGRVFYAQVFDTPDGEAELRGQFYLPRNKAELVADINSGVINSVSVGVKSQKLLCSECGWDYFGEDASFTHLWDRTCENGHTVGQDGVHVRLVGLDLWAETSLVSEGAVSRAKIASRSAARLSAEHRERLAASNLAPEAVVLFADFKEEQMANNDGGKGQAATLDVMALLGQMTDTAVKLTVAEAKVADLTAQVADLEAKLAAAEAKVDADLGAKLAAAEKVASDVKDFLAEQCKAALIAAGQSDPSVPETIEAQLAAIQEAGVKLHQLIQPGGRAKAAAETASEDDDRTVRLAAFKTRK